MLPPVGTEVFRHFTAASLEGIQQHEVEEKDCPKPARDLEAGKPLPFIYGEPSPEHLNTPLEELDPHYQTQKTFLVLGKGNIVDRFNADPVCYLLSPLNPLRTVLGPFSLKWASVSLCLCRFVFIAIYSVEVIVKVMSRGFCVGKFTFLRDPWNWLDVMVVRKFSVLTTVPRILKIIPLIPGVCVCSLKKLIGVFVLTVLTLSFLALLGLEFFQGILRRKCIIIPPQPPNKTSDPDYYGYDTTTIYYLAGQFDPLLCGNSYDAGVCPEGFTCTSSLTNPNFGYTSYDSFGWSLLSMFRMMTQDFWDNLMQMTLRSAGKSHMAFFVFLVFPGCFFAVSLIVAAAAMASGEQEEARAAEARKKEEEFSQIEEETWRPSLFISVVHIRINVNMTRISTHDCYLCVSEVGHQRSCPACCYIMANLLLKWNCCGCWRWVKQRLNTVVMNPFFDLAIIICLIINIGFFATDHFPMSMDFAWHLIVANKVFTVIFTVEMVLKLVAMDPCNYFQVSWNIFDAIIVLVSLLELVMADVQGLSLLRIFRLLRVFRLARWWPCFHMFLKVTWTLLRALRNPALLLLTAFFTFTVVGMQMFKDDYKDHVCRISEHCQLPRWHMNDYFHTFILIFRVLCGSWIETLWDCMEVSGKALCLTFFLTVVVIGNLLVSLCSSVCPETGSSPGGVALDSRNTSPTPGAGSNSSL
uniref:Ion transport domain-containing protein n=1 Tax=Mola mola TaxID=94237 RepID=A0A3Q4B3I1_MOLML